MKIKLKQTRTTVEEKEIDVDFPIYTSADWSSEGNYHYRHSRIEHINGKYRRITVSEESGEEYEITIEPDYKLSEGDIAGSSITDTWPSNEKDFNEALQRVLKIAGLPLPE